MFKTVPVLRVRYAILVDILCIALAYVLACSIRFEATLHLWPYLVDCGPLLWVSLAVRVPVYAAFGLYHRLWRYASTRELISIVAAGTVATLLIYTLNFGLLPLLDLPYCTSRSVVILGWLLNIVALGSTRLALRLAQERVALRDRRPRGAFIPRPRNVLIIGAGDAGAVMAREMRQKPELGLSPVGFVDAHPDKRGMRLHGIPVLGAPEEIPQIARAYAVDEVIIAMPSAPGSLIREVKRLCQGARLPFRVMPGLYDLLDGKVSVTQLREVRIEDLLRRDPIVTDQAGVRAYVRGTCVLVTGAGGSIGSELCRQVARHQPSKLVLLGHGEFSIFNIERELRRRFPDVPLQPVICDVRDAERVRRVVALHQPATIFHAAAHKHVPLMETNVEEAVTNNILGTRCVLEAAEAHGVGRFVMISTDKAVNPTSVMGTTKRAAELLVQETAARTGRPFVAVRFGNVLGSRGSAIPIFQEQIAAGGPVTITHPEMRRFFMTIPEAVQLVLQAASLGRGGEVFMLDMGEPVRIVDIVSDLIELSGLVPGDDVEIAFTGIRPGEKLYEELVLDSEHYGPTPHEKIFLCRSGKAGLDPAHLREHIEGMLALARGMERDALLSELHRLVPEFDCEPAAPRPQ